MTFEQLFSEIFHLLLLSLLQQQQQQQQLLLLLLLLLLLFYFGYIFDTFLVVSCDFEYSLRILPKLHLVLFSEKISFFLHTL